MYYVYILISKKDGHLYIGYTPDLRMRIKKHNAGLVRATKYRTPLTLIYYEAFREQIDAKRREVFLKGGKGRSELKIQLRECFKNLQAIDKE